MYLWMESQVKFHCPQNVSGVSQKNVLQYSTPTPSTPAKGHSARKHPDKQPQQHVRSV